jgi:hypothetical protein
MALDDEIRFFSEKFNVPEEKIRQSLYLLNERQAANHAGYPEKPHYKGLKWIVQVATGLAIAPKDMTANQPYEELVRLGNSYYRDLLK